MKRYILSFAVLALSATCLTGCLEDNPVAGNPVADNPVEDNPVDYLPPSSSIQTKGVYIINNGIYFQGIDGSLTYINYNTEPPSAQQNVFQMVNGESLGGSPNDVLVYGEKMYIAGFDEGVIFVLRAKDAKMLKRIETRELLADEKGNGPYRLAAYDGKLYFCTCDRMETGCVAAIDTTDFKLQEKYPFGSCPLGMAFVTDDNNNVSLYVAINKLYIGEGYISKIDLATGSVTNKSYDKIKAPKDIAVIGNALYVLDAGLADEEYKRTDAGLYEINGDMATMVVPNATGMAIAGNYIHTFNAPFDGVTSLSYSIYDTSSKSLEKMDLIGDSEHPIISPSAIAFDPLTGNIFIASRQSVPKPTYFDVLFPDLDDFSPGFVNVYYWDGANHAQFIETFKTGVEPHKIEFIRGESRHVYE